MTLSIPNLQENIWHSNWFISIIVICILVVTFPIWQKFDNVWNATYMQFMQHATHHQVAVITIDDKSFDQLGQGAWSYVNYAKLIEWLSPHAKLIAIDLDLSQLQQINDQVVLEEFLQFYAEAQPFHHFPEKLAKLSQIIDDATKVRARLVTEQALLFRLKEFYQQTKLDELSQDLTHFEDRLSATYQTLDINQRLRHVIKHANNVVFSLATMTAVHNNQVCIEPYQLNVYENQVFPAQSIEQLRFPLQNLLNQAIGLGVNVSDNTWQPLLIHYQDAYLPSLPLLLASKNQQLKLKGQAIRLQSEDVLFLDKQKINAPNLQIQPFFPQQDLPIYAFVDVLKGDISATRFKDKIVLLGTTLNQPTIQSFGQLPSVLRNAYSLSSLLNQDFLIQPYWTLVFKITIALLGLLYLAFFLPRLSRRHALWMTVGILFLITLSNYYLLHMGYAVSLLFIFLFVILGYIAHQLRNAFIIYQDAFLSHPNAVESNRLLGLAFQGQGQLDLAFEKFRLCPPDSVILPLLYNLALDYEMKGVIRGARMVYRYILKYDDSFRDVENRLAHLNRHCAYPHINRKNKYLDLELCDHDNDKPILGKYQLERKLGKGAMGVVYLARDTKLHRLVAVKTLALSQEFEDEELADATTRFFLEANAAGRLQHDNIIAIYDAGEEQDLAYIAMEFFKGGNLAPYTKVDNLLPISKVIDIVIHASEALDYAFQHGVVHRDIKPANIMYNPATEQIKLTDFGIARITDHHKTRTGEILGTPSYMSPEQLAGKAVDGRTDLFSLGVTLYQLLTGQLPFQARSMASLMFKIANETHADITTLRADIPNCLKTVVDKALQKEVKDRFQCGAEFAQALRDCGNEV